jgi:hypothetical protein
VIALFEINQDECFLGCNNGIFPFLQIADRKKEY